jgi:hypothetical protein
MTNLKIPCGPEAIAPEWPTQDIRSAGARTNATVKSAIAEILLQRSFALIDGHSAAGLMPE